LDRPSGTYRASPRTTPHQSPNSDFPPPPPSPIPPQSPFKICHTHLGHYLRGRRIAKSKSLNRQVRQRKRKNRTLIIAHEHSLQGSVKINVYSGSPLRFLALLESLAVHPDFADLLTRPSCRPGKSYLARQD
jgi:hypothetical protein